MLFCLFQNYFSINSSDGSVSVLALADREVAQEYRIQITVTDLNAFNTPPQTATSMSIVIIISGEEEKTCNSLLFPFLNQRYLI